MHRSLSREQHPLASPWSDYMVLNFSDASDVAEPDREALMDAMNAIIAVNWNAREPHWTAASSPFDGTYSLIAVYDGAELVAFSVYRLLRIGGRAAIYRSGTEVLPAHQGRGLYGFFTSQVLRHAREIEPADASIFYGWRTRNPIVWAANAKICKKVTPSLFGNTQDATLQAACVEMCTKLHPGKCLETPSMIMRGAYGHIKHRRQAYRGAALLVDAAMSRLIPNPADALFSVGYMRA
jgi:GNAT superfamily N-acetyltransferase